jgi:DNA-binding CsgD family transcriptional regulator
MGNPEIKVDGQTEGSTPLRDPGDHEPEDSDERPSVRCSFCLKDSRDAGSLVEGPERFLLGRAYICRNCVEICVYIFMDVKRKSLATEDAAAVGKFVLTPLAQMIEETLKTLNDTEREIIKLRYGLDGGYNHTLLEIGRRLNLTSENVGRYETQAITKLRLQRQPPMKP